MKDTLNRLLSQKVPTLVVGPPGVGKTETIREVGSELGLKNVTHLLTLGAPEDWRGLPVRGPGGTAKFAPYGIAKFLLEKNLPPTLVLVDELGQASRENQAAFMSVLHTREIDGVPIHPGVQFAMATNRAEDFAGVRSVLAPLLNRVAIVKCEVDVLTWVTWATRAGVDYRLVAFVDGNPDMLWRPPTTGITASPSPRSIVALSKHIIRGKADRDVVEAFCGGEFAAKFVVYASIGDALPSREELLAGTARVPSELSSQFAMTALVADMICRGHDVSGALAGMAPELANNVIVRVAKTELANDFVSQWAKNNN